MFKIHRDNIHRIAYATDASVYREVPYGVAYPENEEHIASLIEFALSHNIDLIPRAGGTSIAGQVVGSGIVCDISKHLNKILEINPSQRWARVQPGVVRDELNLALKPYGLFFSPETSTSNRCCIGGMMGNNSCGTHSLVYGSTRDHLISAKGFLSDGTIEVFKEYSIEELEERFGSLFWEKTELDSSGGTKSQTLAEKIYAQLIRFATDTYTSSLIKDTFPDKDLKRRSCGYAIDEVIENLVMEKVGQEQSREDFLKEFRKRTINLCRLLSGSEGTLAFITEITVSLDPLPKPDVLALCAHCASLEKSFRANLISLKHSPEAIELIDADILALSRTVASQRQNSFFVEGSPAALLITEFRGENRQETEAKAEELENELLASGLSYRCTRVYGADVSKVWNLRKAGLGVLNSMKGDAKPTGVVEDTAVAPKFLPDYLLRFKQMADRIGVKCVFYGHISTGELHLRPILNLKTEDGLQKFRKIAFETALLVKEFRGTISGEHGDGRLRGEFIKVLYGERTYQLMLQIKRCWDMRGVFNRHKIVDTLPMDSFLRYSPSQHNAIEDSVLKGETYYNWKASFDECSVEGATGAKNQLSALMCSIEQCNGAADCRKSNLMGGTMCPAYKVSSDETKTTRARANILREFLTRGSFSDVYGEKHTKNVFDIPEIKEVLDSCLSCKGCLGECPSGVDLTRLRSEVLQHIYSRKGIPFRTMMVSNMARIEKIGHFFRPFYNFYARFPVSEYLIKKIIGFSEKRHIPSLSRYTMRMLIKKENRKYKQEPGQKKVYLFADEFTNYQEAELGLTFARLLMKLGYNVQIPHHLESGRAAISKGCLKMAKKYAERNVELLSGIVTEDTPLVGVEPSCILSFRDEYPDLVPSRMREKAKLLSKSCLLYDEFLLREIENGHISVKQFSEASCKIFLHGHCHQKALVGVEKTEKALKQLLSGCQVNVIPSGCCGMAGSFGYEKEHYQTSMAIGEMVLFPAVRKAVSEDSVQANPELEANDSVIVSAPGTSCRQQIFDGTGVKALHPIEILYRYLSQT